MDHQVAKRAETPASVGIYPWKILATAIDTSSSDQFAEAEHHHYRYAVAARRFAPVLEHLGEVVWLDRPESRLEFAAQRARQQERVPIALAFRPFQDFYPARSAANVIYLFWEYPDLLEGSVNYNPRYAWARMSQWVQQILAGSTFTAEAFARAGVRTPVHVVPVPVAQEWFALSFWDGPCTNPLPMSACMLQQKPPQTKPQAGELLVPPTFRSRLMKKLRAIYASKLKRFVPAILERQAVQLVHRFGPKVEPALGLELDECAAASGVVYTAVLDSGPQNDWQDLVSAFVSALRDRADAMLLLCTVDAESKMSRVLAEIWAFYQRLASIPHKCRILVAPALHLDNTMLRLAACTTYYVNATRAEAVCLPLQDMLAAGRPALSPTHTAMRDYFDADVGFVIESHPELCGMPGLPEGQFRTTWHRLVWQSLHDQFQASYTLAQQPAAYQAMAARARERMKQWASTERVLERLRDALDSLAATAPPVPQADLRRSQAA